MSVVFVTGASGYVGRHVAHEFVARGHEVHGLVRSAQGARRLAQEGIAPVLGDLERPETFLDAAGAADCIVHAGFAYSADGSERPEVDACATQALLRVAADGKTRSYVYTASVFRYGSPTGGIFTEESATPRSADDWRHDLSQSVLARKSERLATSVIRLAWIYGSEGGTLPQALRSLAGMPRDAIAGGNRVPFCEVRQVAVLYADIALGRHSGVFHACQGQPTPLDALHRAAQSSWTGDAAAQATPEEYAGVFGLDTPAVTTNPLSLRGLNASVLDDHLSSSLA